MEFLARVGVVIPAHNEQDLLPACLAAVLTAARGVALPVDVMVVLDACTDNSARTAAAFTRHDLPGVTLTTMTVSHRSVGAARRAGAAALLHAHDVAGTWLATTDADSTVPEHWLQAQQMGVVPERRRFCSAGFGMSEPPDREHCFSRPECRGLGLDRARVGGEEVERLVGCRARFEH